MIQSEKMPTQGNNKVINPIKGNAGSHRESGRENGGHGALSGKLKNLK